MEKKVATCTECSSQFNIIKQEEEFLQKKGLPLPNECPSCRQERRLKMREERQLYKTVCAKCGKEIIVAFDPTKVQNPIFCRKDYEQYLVEHDPIISDPLP